MIVVSKGAKISMKKTGDTTFVMDSIMVVKVNIYIFVNYKFHR